MLEIILLINLTRRIVGLMSAGASWLARLRCMNLPSAVI